MSGSANWIPARLVCAVLDVPERAHTVGEAIWLYLYLLVEVSQQGRICRPAGKLAADLGVPEPEIETWLAHLVSAGLAVVLNPSPFLVIRLPLWSGRSQPHAVDRAEISGSDREAHIEVPVSSSSAAAASSNHGEDGGQGEGEGLLREVLATLDEADPTEFAKLIARHPAEVVRRALQRVRSTPPAQIRKSKVALFRYLLAKLA